MKYLFSHWDKVFSKIEKSLSIFLFFDYDGTLTPIVSRPEDAKFSPRVKNLIKKLNKNSRFTVSIISGRSLKNVKKMVGIKNLIYAGNHGMEIEGKHFKTPILKSNRNIIKKIKSSLDKECKDIKGSRVEDKSVTLSLHYRLVKSKDQNLIKNRFKKTVAPYVRSKRIKISSGKKVLEVRPNIKWNKGDAVKEILKKRKKALPIYLGDDVTDIDVFRAIKNRGISIFVGKAKRDIGADYYLKNPKDVEKFIKRLI